MPTPSNLEFAQASIVVVAQTHNPSILHPSFLKAEGIVPSSWVPLETVTTPVLAVAKYEGFAFTVEPSKLQIVRLPFQLGDQTLVQMASKYVQVLPKVPYKSVGINPQLFMELPEPGVFVIDRFLSSGPWRQAASGLEHAEIKLVLKRAATRLHLSLVPATVEKPGQRTDGLLITGNYHFDTGSVEAVQDVINRFQSLCEDFLSLAKGVLAA